METYKEGIVAQVKKRNIAKYGHLQVEKSVVLATMEGELEGRSEFQASCGMDRHRTLGRWNEGSKGECGREKATARRGYAISSGSTIFRIVKMKMKRKKQRSSTCSWSYKL